jgi:hypothetical protein
MRNKFFILLFVFVIGFSFTTTTFANNWLPFGGTIISVPATEITAAQSAGFVCPEAALTFTIKPVSKSPVSFKLIAVRKGFEISVSKLILGLYTTTTPVTCTNTATGATMTVPLADVLLYGTSK